MYDRRRSEGVEVPYRHTARDAEPVALGDIPRDEARNQRLVQLLCPFEKTIKVSVCPLRSLTPRRRPRSIARGGMPFGDFRERAAETHNMGLDAVRYPVARVEAEGVLARDDVRVEAALREVLLEPLGDGATAEVKHSLGGVRLLETLARQQCVGDIDTALVTRPPAPSTSAVASLRESDGRVPVMTTVFPFRAPSAWA